MSNLALVPDWSQNFSKENFESEFNMPMTGPGFYLTETDTMLVTANRPEDDSTVENVWNHQQPEGTLWEVHVWNCNFRETIFGALSVAPTRMDKRELRTG